MEATARKPSWAEHGLAHYDNETPEMRRERERLERRIREESGPVRTTSAVEEIVPHQGGRGKQTVRLGKRGLSISRAIIQRLATDVRDCRIEINHVRKTLSVTLEKGGPWTLSMSKSSQAHVGGPVLVRNLAERGVEQGLYNAKVDAGKRIVVDFSKGPKQ